jgi:hypothetical protein
MPYAPNGSNRNRRRRRGGGGEWIYKERFMFISTPLTLLLEVVQTSYLLIPVL